MSAVDADGVLNPLLSAAATAPRSDSPAFGLRSDVSITVPFWFVLVVCFTALMMVFLSLGFLYAALLAEPAIITISGILSQTDTVVKSMVASSAGAISSGHELVRSAMFFFYQSDDVKFSATNYSHVVHFQQAFESRM
jgi:hypothetical protein